MEKQSFFRVQKKNVEEEGYDLETELEYNRFLIQERAITERLEPIINEVKQKWEKIKQGWKNLNIAEKQNKINEFKTTIDAQYPNIWNVAGRAIDDMITEVTTLGGALGERHKTKKTRSNRRRNRKYTKRSSNRKNEDRNVCNNKRSKTKMGTNKERTGYS